MSAIVRYPLSIEEDLYNQIQIKAKEKSISVAKYISQILRRSVGEKNVVLVRPSLDSYNLVPIPEEDKENYTKLKNYLSDEITQEEIKKYEPTVFDLSHRYQV